MKSEQKNPDAVELAPLPVPVDFESDMDRPVPFDAGATVRLDCPDAAAATWLAHHFADWFGAQAPRVVAEAGAGQRIPATGGASSPSEPSPANGGASPPGEPESYTVFADSSGVRIAARSLAGVRWAAYSLRQLAIARRGTLRTEGRLLPTLRISDAPRLALRAVHLCWFPETRPERIERAIRLAALLKFNCAIVEPWGTFRSARHPWFGWPDAPATPEALSRLAAIGSDLGVTLVPQLNVFGHASLSRTSSLKHAALDLRPEYEPLFEPGGWNWCLSNPEARRVLRELVDEMHEACGRPPFFHLGCDEAQPPSCPACRRRPYGELVREHVAAFAAFVRERGARAMVWHDMLLDRRDPRWNGYIVCGDERLTGLLDKLPRDFIVCDWQYYYPDEGGKLKEPDWTTTKHFIASGRDTLACPWLNTAGTLSLGRCIADQHGFGLLETSWHRIQGHDFFRVFFHGAWAAWNPHADSPNHAHCDLLALMDFHVRQTTQDMGATRYEEFGISQKQIHGPYYQG